jgi:host factor-I protein
MSSDKKQNLQDIFLNAVRKGKTPLTVFLVNGVKLQGIVTWFDNFCVLLKGEGRPPQLVYKHRSTCSRTKRARTDCQGT